MNIGEICRRRAVTVQRGDDLSVAARLMREHHAGFLAVTESDSRARVARVVEGQVEREIRT